MVDFANQMRSSVLQLYGTNDFRLLTIIKERCSSLGVDFWNPGIMRNRIIEEARQRYGLGNNDERNQ